MNSPRKHLEASRSSRKLFNISQLFLAMVLVLTASIAACGGGSSGGGGGASSTSVVSVTGTVDSSIVLASSQPTMKDFLANLFVHRVYASSTTVDNIVAGTGNGYTKATLSGNSFSFSLPTNKNYIIILLHGTSVVGIMQADSSTGMYSLPVSSSSSSIDVGTVSVAGSTNTGAPLAQGSTSSPTLLSDLGISSSISNDIGAYDISMQQLSSMDVDGNGILDFTENRAYHINVDYEFSETQNGTFVAIEGGATSSYQSANYLGYEYYVSLTNPYPSFSSLNWSGATMTPPASITTVSGSTEYSQCYTNSYSSSQEELNFYCRTTNATSPTTPPTGTYTITVPLTTGGNQNFTFNNVTSQTISTQLYNIYVPAVSITYSNGNVTKINWQWWKNTPSGWTQPSDIEIASIMQNVGFEIGMSGWPSTRLNGNLPITASGSYAPSAQSFTAQALRITYTDMTGYTYGFEWD